jgi:hypothetical protein
MWLQYANKERKTPLDVTSDEEIREAWLFVCKAQETTDQMPLDIPSDEDVREKRLLARQAQATTEDFTRFVMRCVDQSRPRHQHRTDDEEVIEKWLFVRRLQATTGLEHLDTPNDGDVSEKRLSECRAQATMDSRSLDVPSDEEVIEMWRYVLRAHATSVDITRLVMQCANQEEQRRQRRTIDEDGRDALMFKFRSDATTTTRVPASIVMLRANQGVPSRKEVHDTQKYIAYKAHRRLLEQERSQDGVTINILHNNCGEHRSSRDHVRCEQCMPIDVWSVASMICEERPVASLKEVRQNIHCAPFANTGYVWLTGAELLDGVHVQLMWRVGDGLVRCVASPDIRSLNLIFYALLGTLSMEDLKRKSSRGERLQ